METCREKITSYRLFPDNQEGTYAINVAKVIK